MDKTKVKKKPAKKLRLKLGSVPSKMLILDYLLYLINIRKKRNTKEKKERHVRE